MHESLRHLDHRPWPLPTKRWAWRQSWLDLAFIHYRVAAATLRAIVPGELTVQEFDGSAWVGLVPFRMAGVMRRGLPDLPGFSTFPELNLRTYVERNGKPGVWFFSLDAASWPIVIGGRRLYGLPYYVAQMTLNREKNGWHGFVSKRRGTDVYFEASYRPLGRTSVANPGSFEHWATERYCLYAARNGRMLRVEVHHAPWPLQSAEVEIRSDSLLETAGIQPLLANPVCHFSPGVHVVSFPPEIVASLLNRCTGRAKAQI